MPSANNSGPPVIRLAHPLGFAAFLKHLGAPVEGYFRRQGLPVLCKEPNVFVPLKKAWALFDDAPTLYQALQVLIRLVNSELSHLRLGLLEKHHHILFYTTGYAELKKEPGFSSSQSYQLAAYIDLIRHFAGPSWVPEVIGIHDSTVPAVVEEHFPSCRVRVGQPISYLVIPRSCLHLQVRIRHVESSAATPLIFTDDLNFAEALSLLLKPYLPQGYPSVSFAASLADTSARTLARRLSECGKTYQCVVDEARFNVARELLRDTDEQISEIAGSVGFSDQANFSRFFQRVGGLSPRDFRVAVKLGV